jgi:hypothetical protein
MPRDSSRNLYITIGMPRDSDTLRRLLEEVTETGIALSQIVVVRLTDYYRQRTSAPASTQASAPSREPVTPSTGTDDLQARAAQAAVAWAFEEDEEEEEDEDEEEKKGTSP